MAGLNITLGLREAEDLPKVTGRLMAELGWQLHHPAPKPHVHSCKARMILTLEESALQLQTASGVSLDVHSPLPHLPAATHRCGEPLGGARGAQSRDARASGTFLGCVKCQASPLCRY